MSIEAQRMSWGSIIERWNVRSTDTGGYVIATDNTREALADPAPASLPSGTFQAVRGALEPVAKRLEEGVPCDGNLPTDQDTWVISWSRIGNTAQFWLYAGCTSREAGLAVAGIRDATRMMKAAAGVGVDE